jgi:Tol biopolymer transport system component
MMRIRGAVIGAFAVTAAASAGLLLFAACGGDGGGGSSAQIVYEAQVSGAVNVFRIDPDSGDTVQLTSDPRFSGHPAWSPDRERIIFVSNRDGQQRFDIYTMDADGGDVSRLTDTPDDNEIAPKYSPDGEQITMAVNQEGDWWLGLMDAEGGEIERIAGPFLFVEFPTWTRDGSAIYFAARARDFPDSDIYSIDLETRETKLEIRNKGNDVCPHFTYDGELLLWASPAADDRMDLDIWAKEFPDGEPYLLTDTPFKDDYSNPNPDNDAIVFLSERDGNPELYVMDMDGGNQRRLTNTPDARENVPDW